MINTNLINRIVTEGHQKTTIMIGNIFKIYIPPKEAMTDISAVSSD